MYIIYLVPVLLRVPRQKKQCIWNRGLRTDTLHAAAAVPRVHLTWAESTHSHLYYHADTYF